MNSLSGVHFMRISKDTLLELVSEVVEEFNGLGSPLQEQEQNTRLNDALGDVITSLDIALDEAGEGDLGQGLSKIKVQIEALQKSQTVQTNIADAPDPVTDDSMVEEEKDNVLYGEGEELEEEIELNEDELQEMIMNELEALYE